MEDGPAGRPPVLYLDIDDTLIVWHDGRPRAAEGAREFVSWAMERFEVRWLTRWCPEGHMPSGLLEDFCDLLDLSPDLLRCVRGGNWVGNVSKVDGILWLEHIVLGRPFLWVEDDYGFGAFERRFLEDHGFSECWLRCNVSEDPRALVDLMARLRAGETDPDLVRPSRGAHPTPETS